MGDVIQRCLARSRQARRSTKIEADSTSAIYDTINQSADVLRTDRSIIIKSGSKSSLWHVLFVNN